MGTSRVLAEAMRQEVEWYLRNGAHGRNRIGCTSDGAEYVIGDSSWNKSGRPPEYIELQMSHDLRHNS